MIEEKTTGIPRIACMYAKDLRDHVRAIGKSIMEDADKLNIEPPYTGRIEICVEIDPSNKVTLIDWTIERAVFPEVKR